MPFRGYVNSCNLVIYRTPHWTNTIGILSLTPGWQDSDHVWTSQDIYWEDKYDCLSKPKGVRLAA